MPKKKQMKKAFTFTLEDPVYSIDTYLIVGSREQAEAIMKKKYDYEYTIYNGADGLHLFLENKCSDGHITGFESVIWLEEFKKGENYSLSTLAHEVFHKTADTLERTGTYLDHKSNGEAYAYYYGYVFRGLLEALSKRK